MVLSQRRCGSNWPTAARAASGSSSRQVLPSRVRVMSISITSRRTRRAVALILSIGAVSLFTTGAGTQGPRFYPDDPISREPESQDASKAAPYEQSQMYELMFNLFVTSGYKPSGLRAKNINTIDEVPDSSWFTNRIGAKPITADEITKGPVIGAAPD